MQVSLIALNVSVLPCSLNRYLPLVVHLPPFFGVSLIVGPRDDVLAAAKGLPVPGQFEVPGVCIGEVDDPGSVEPAVGGLCALAGDLGLELAGATGGDRDRSGGE